MLGFPDRQPSCLVLGLALALGQVVPLLAQGRTDLPPPEASRPPLITTQAPDSIRRQTARLRLGELALVLQAGDELALNALFDNATLEGSTCVSPSVALSRAATRVSRVLRSGGQSLALFFDNISVRDEVGVSDSTTAQVITADVVLVPASSREIVRRSVTLSLDSDGAAWTQEAGLLRALCDL